MGEPSDVYAPNICGGWFMSGMSNPKSFGSLPIGSMALLSVGDGGEQNRRGSVSLGSRIGVRSR